MLTAKNRVPRPTIDAAINIGKLIWNAPALIVTSFYGIGVSSGANTAKVALSA